MYHHTMPAAAAYDQSSYASYYYSITRRGSRQTLERQRPPRPLPTQPQPPQPQLLHPRQPPQPHLLRTARADCLDVRAAEAADALEGHGQEHVGVAGAREAALHDAQQDGAGLAAVDAGGHTLQARRRGRRQALGSMRSRGAADGGRRIHPCHDGAEAVEVSAVQDVWSTTT